MLKYLILKGVLVIMMKKMLNDETEVTLANILYNYIKHGGLSNEKFVFDCLSAIRELNDLNSDLNHLIFKDMGKKTYASYNYSKKTITINKRKLNDFFTHDKSEKKLSVLNTVLHETSHVFQSKKIEQDNDLEVKLLKSEDGFEKSNSFNHLFWKLIYNYLYLCLPSERLAIYNSYDSMINILKILRPHNISRYIDDCEIDCFLHLDNYVYKKNDYY